jgi:hypothetical protein
VCEEKIKDGGILYLVLCNEWVEGCVESTCALFLLVCIDLKKGRENNSFLVDVDH